MQLRLPPVLSSFVHHRQRFSEYTKSLFWLPYRSIGLGQQDEIIWPFHFSPRGQVGSQAPAYLYYPLHSLSLLHQRPTLQDSPPRRPEWKPLLGREDNSRLCLLSGYLRLTAKLMELSSHYQGKR